MTTVTGLTAERMIVIENASVVSGQVTGDNLILVTKGGTQINAGVVRGPQGTPGTNGQDGSQGPPGPATTVGLLGDFPKLPVPFGWLACDGAIYNIADYPALGAYLTNYYGGNGTTTFAVPNLKGRIRVGLDAGQPEFDSLGKIGGEKAHILLPAELAVHAHGHSLSAVQHYHAISHNHQPEDGGEFVTTRTGEGAYAGGIGGSHDVSVSQPNPNTSGWASSTGIGGSINNAGSGQPHNNLQPYFVSVTAIKT